MANLLRPLLAGQKTQAGSRPRCNRGTGRVFVLVLVAIAAATTGCRGGADLRQTLRDWVAAWNRRDLPTLNRVFLPNGTFTGFDGKTGPAVVQRAAFAGLWALVPDAQLRIVRWLPTERGMAVTWIIEGKSVSGLATSLRGLCVAEGSGTKLAALRCYSDVTPLLRLLPPRPSSST